MSNLNLFQQVCLLMFTVDLAAMFVGSEKLLQIAMNKATRLMIDKWLGRYGWSITWGPRVWKSKDSSLYAGLDNCWMIAKAPGVPYPDGSKWDTYVVAIAGTAVFSKTDWSREDFGVDNVVDFDNFTKTFKTGPIPEPQKGQKPPTEGPGCALGTAWGVYQLVTNTSPDGNPGEKTTILDYLAGLNRDKGDFRVIFAGHSLGGALSPFLSLAVKANGLIPALADSPDNILTFPAAGATPGDARLRDAYNILFPISGPGGYQQWNGNLYNELDIVPQAWSTNNDNDRFLDKIIRIYGTLKPNLHKVVQEMVELAKNRANASGIVYEPIKGNRFTGSPPKHPPRNFPSFVAEAVIQHTKAYYDEVGTSDVVAQLYKATADTDGIERKTARQAALSLPVLFVAADLANPVPDEDGPPQYADVSYPFDCILNT